MSTRADMAPPAAAKTKASTLTALDPRTRLWALVAAGACLLPLLLQLPPVMGAVIAALGVVIGGEPSPPPARVAAPAAGGSAGGLRDGQRALQPWARHPLRASRGSSDERRVG